MISNRTNIHLNNPDPTILPCFKHTHNKNNLKYNYKILLSPPATTSHHPRNKESSKTTDNHNHHREEDMEADKLLHHGRKPRVILSKPLLSPPATTNHHPEEDMAANKLLHHRRKPKVILSKSLLSPPSRTEKNLLTTTRTSINLRWPECRPTSRAGPRPCAGSEGPGTKIPRGRLMAPSRSNRSCRSHAPNLNRSFSC